MISYKDFDTQKQHFTRGKFVKWIRGGPLNAWMAVIQRRRSTLFIPEYCLTPESKQSLPRPSEEDTSATDPAVRAESGRWNLPYDSAFDGRGLCPKCGGAETRNGELCRVCREEAQADQS